jgi:hypothetical protein
LSQTRQERLARLSPYGVVKRAEVLGALSPGEQEEVERLEARPRRSLAQEARLDELWRKAFGLGVPPQVDPLFAYAQEVGEWMRARLPSRRRAT